MLLNPLINIALALVSLILGTVALINTDNWIFMLPSLFFMVLFPISLLRPIAPPTRTRYYEYRAPRPRKQLAKLTVARLRSLSASSRKLSGSLFPDDEDDSQHLSHTSA